MSLPGTANDEIRQQAKLQANKAEQRRIEAVKALKAHDLARNAERAKTVRLRELRLIKEVEEVVARKASEMAKGTKPPRAKKAGIGKA